MHAKRTWRRSKLSNYGNTRTKQQSRIIILVAICRFLNNSHTHTNTRAQARTGRQVAACSQSLQVLAHPWEGAAIDLTLDGT